MITKAKIYLKDGKTIYRTVEYIKAAVYLEIGGERRVFQPRYFFKEGKEVLLELVEANMGDQVKWNT